MLTMGLKFMLVVLALLVLLAIVAGLVSVALSLTDWIEAWRARARGRRRIEVEL